MQAHHRSLKEPRDRARQTSPQPFDTWYVRESEQLIIIKAKIKIRLHIELQELRKAQSVQ